MPTALLFFGGLMVAHAQTAPKADDSTAPFQLDLTPHFNLKFSAPGYKGPGKSFPTETNFDGLPFTLKGQISVWGRTQAERDIVLRERVEGIVVGRAFEELHLLHHAFWQDTVNETIATLRLNYADGTHADLPIRYGVQVLDWFRLPSEDKETITDAQTKIVWRGEAPNAARLNSTLRLFKSTLANPHPDKVVKTLDVLSERKSASYSLIAATVARRDPTRPQSAPAVAMEFRKPFGGALKLKVVDAATDKPVEGALIDPGMAVGDVGVVAPQVTTSSTGEAVVRYQEGQTQSVMLSVSKAGFRSERMAWEGAIPAEHTIRLQPATTVVGGVVKDEQGRPVAGVKVSLVERGSSIGGPTSASTDAEGRWRLSTWSENSIGLHLRVEHPEFVSATIMSDVREGAATPGYVSLTELRAEKAELQIRRGYTLNGIVKNAAGEPVTNARVNVESDNVTSRIATDFYGKFTASRLPAGNYTMVVQAPNCAPEMRDVAVGKEMNAVEVTLEKGHVVKGLVVDAAGKPVAGARVTLESWRGKPFLRWNVETDADGRFQWGAAPADGMSISISKPGYETLRNIRFKANGELETFRLPKPQPVIPGFRGRIFDTI